MREYPEFALAFSAISQTSPPSPARDQKKGGAAKKQRRP
jgi:hypothetical protein